VGRPVRVQGMRHEGHGWDPKGPASVHHARAALDKDDAVIGVLTPRSPCRSITCSVKITERRVRSGEVGLKLLQLEILAPQLAQDTIVADQMAGADGDEIAFGRLQKASESRHCLR
jgi:hypothetical protein